MIGGEGSRACIFCITLWNPRLVISANRQLLTGEIVLRRIVPKRRRRYQVSGHRLATFLRPKCDVCPISHVPEECIRPRLLIIG
jgi:hypothetical protein